MRTPPPEVLAGWAQRRRQEEEARRRALALASAVAEDVAEDAEGSGMNVELYRTTLGSQTITVTSQVILVNDSTSGQITQIPVRQITNVTKRIEGFWTKKHHVTIYYFAGQRSYDFWFAEPSHRDALFDAIQQAMTTDWTNPSVVDAIREAKKPRPSTEPFDAGKALDRMYQGMYKDRGF